MVSQNWEFSSFSIYFRMNTNSLRTPQIELRFFPNSISTFFRNLQIFDKTPNPQISHFPFPLSHRVTTFCVFFFSNQKHVSFFITYLCWYIDGGTLKYDHGIWKILRSHYPSHSVRLRTIKFAISLFKSYSVVLLDSSGNTKQSH